MAHIVAYSPNGPRADASYPAEKLNSYDNLILLCGTHHGLIDSLAGDYPVERLRQMKADHEVWVQKSLKEQISHIGFAELEVAIKAIMSPESMKVNDSFEVTPPGEKISKNNLTASSHNLIVQGLSLSDKVQEYIKRQSKLDEGYPERLTKGFRDEYDKLVQDGLGGDALFDSMVAFSSGGSQDFKRRAAGLAILSHLFLLCEIFER